MTMWLAVSLIGFLYVTGMVTVGTVIWHAFNDGYSARHSRPNWWKIVSTLILWPVLAPCVLVMAVFE